MRNIEAEREAGKEDRNLRTMLAASDLPGAVGILAVMETELLEARSCKVRLVDALPGRETHEAAFAMGRVNTLTRQVKLVRWIIARNWPDHANDRRGAIAATRARRVA